MLFAMIVAVVGLAFAFGVWGYRNTLSIPPPPPPPLDDSFNRAKYADDVMLQQGWFMRDAGEEGRQLGYWGEG